jgi:hypothetical protein
MHGGIYGGHSDAAMAGHRRFSTEDAVRSKLIKALALGAHHIDDVHARRIGKATEQVHRCRGRTRWPELEKMAASRRVCALTTGT